MKNWSFGILLLIPILLIPSSAFAESPAYDTSHSQGDGYQCATSPTQQMECQMLNLLSDLMPKIVQQLQWQNGNLTKYIQTQNAIILKQQQEIDALTKTLSSITTTSSPTTNSQQQSSSNYDVPQTTVKTTQSNYAYPIPVCKMTPSGVKC